jgi:hypothetical protein
MDVQRDSTTAESFLGSHVAVILCVGLLVHCLLEGTKTLMVLKRSIPLLALFDVVLCLFILVGKRTVSCR